MTSPRESIGTLEQLDAEHVHEPYDALQHSWEGPGCLCVVCGVRWPGYPLPEPPAKRVAGYGELSELPSWRSRVDAMINGLEEVA